MCLKLLLGFFVGYNNLYVKQNSNAMRPSVISHRNIETGSKSIEMTNHGCDYKYNYGIDERFNNNNDTEQILKINNYFEMAKQLKILEASMPIIENEPVATILHDFFDYNSIQPMRITNGGLLSDW
jgi:hypothetical protein